MKLKPHSSWCSFGLIFIFIFLFLLLGSSQLATAENLDLARKAFKAGDVKGASDFYSKITPSDAEWNDKLEDSIRWFLLNKKYQSAWRVTQMAIHTRRDVNKVTYYEKLAAIKFGACPFGSSVGPVSFDLLLRAYGARFYQRFAQSPAVPVDADVAADRGVQVTTLADFETPNLRDLKRTKLLLNRGCRFSRPKYKDSKFADEAELDYLRRYMAWVSSHPEDRLEDERPIQIRIMELAQRLKYDDLATSILTMFNSISLADWAKMRDPERRYLWNAMVKQELIPSGVLPLGGHDERVVKSILPTADAVNAASWLGIVNFDEWPINEREILFGQLDQLTDLPFHDEIVYRRAILSYEAGAHTKTIEFVRRILATEDASEAARQGALTIVERLLSEYQYNEAMLGAIQGAVPMAYWPRIYRGLLIDHALRGNLKGFLAIKNQLFAKSKSSGSSRLSLEAMAIYEALAHRKGLEYAKLIEKLHDRRPNEFVHYANDIAERAEGLSDDEYDKVEDVILQLTKIIRKDLDSGKSQEQMTGLLASLERAARDQRSTAEKSARGGVSHVGAVNIRPFAKLTNPYVWTEPVTLGRRELLAMPTSVGDRTWHLE